MVNNKNNLLLVVGVALIVAVVASLGTVALTGNVAVSKASASVDVPTKQEVLDTLNQCKYYGGTLAAGQSCSTICKTPSLWGQSGPSSTCVTAEFGYNDNSAYSKSLVRCGFQETGRKITCVCC